MMHKSTDTETPPAADDAYFETLEFAVAGERPTQHGHRIEKLLSGAVGVRTVEAHPADKRVLICYDARLTGPAQLHEQLVAKGYKSSPRAD